MARQLISDTITELLQTFHLLTAPELLDKLHDAGKPVNKTTVYRSLEKLESSGVICKHNLVNNDLAYELRDQHHDHLICNRCGKVESAECQINIPADLNSFQVSHHHLTLYGVCNNCQHV